MRFITDLHIHSRFSRACSKELTIPNIAKMCVRKGVDIIGTGDFTHPAWRKEIGDCLSSVGNGAFELKDRSVATKFFLTTELSSIYKRGGKTRRVHNVICMPSLEAVDRFIARLTKRGCNLKSDGRPILGIDSEELLKMALDADENALLIPAHIWTPWFAMFGSQSGFDSMEECFGEMTKYIYAVETGLSSDPPMNWRLSQLDRVFLVSNSDAHSLGTIAREANVFDMDVPSYDEFRRILVEHDTKKFIETLEFFPEEGKYHVDGHRACGFWCEPVQTKRMKGMCPKCGKPLTIGVLYRVDDLADRKEGKRPVGAPPFRSVVPLPELIGEAIGVGKTSKKVKLELEKLLASGHSEFAILLDFKEDILKGLTRPEIVEAIMHMRRGEVDIRPGYDGEFGVVSLVGHKAKDLKEKQATLL